MPAASSHPSTSAKEWLTRNKVTIIVAIIGLISNALTAWVSLDIGREQALSTSASASPLGLTPIVYQQIRITDSGGKGIANAKVTLDAPEYLITVRSDTNGLASAPIYETLANERAIIRIEAVSYPIYNQHFILQPSGLPLEIVLQP